MQMPERAFAAQTGYRYGFNGKDINNELWEGGTDFGARVYTPTIGRWFSRDKLEDKYPSLSTYCFSHNSPLIYADGDGRDIVVTITVKDGKTGKTEIRNVTYKDFYKEVEGRTSDGRGHGSDGVRKYYDLNVVVNVDIDKSGKETVQVNYSGVLRATVSRGPNEADDDKKANIKMAISDTWDAITKRIIGPQQKMKDFKGGFLLTSSNVKNSSGNPLEPGASEQVDVIREADVFLTAVSRSISMVDIKDMKVQLDEVLKSSRLERNIDGTGKLFDSGQGFIEASGGAKETQSSTPKATPVVVTEYRQKRYSSDQNSRSVSTGGKRDTIKITIYTNDKKKSP
ncbi:MAG: hypothetical protein EOO15_01605 [Chitinophagaceae bacterium]|nr:MAG: hypothetical protein EOO15_01605 [Chitinophagaceae bacterium]